MAHRYGRQEQMVLGWKGWFDGEHFLSVELTDAIRCNPAANLCQAYLNCSGRRLKPHRLGWHNGFFHCTGYTQGPEMWGDREFVIDGDFVIEPGEVFFGVLYGPTKIELG